MDVHLKRWWLASIVFRLLSALSQPGYTHPDEYFQSIEVAAGDVFDLRTHIPWEFNASRPVRSYSSVGLLVAGPLKLYKLVCDGFGWSPDFHFVHLLPRLVNVVLSLFCDFCVIRLCRRAKMDPKLALLLFWTAAPLYTHLLRPLSNAWETFYLSGILLLCGDQLRPLTAVLQGFLLAFGIFCRPTFPLFATLPFFVQLGCSLQRSTISTLGLHFLLLLSFCAGAALCMLCDAVYFGGFPITPLNFLAYNWNSANLASHGRHPWFTHILVNLPQLVGPAWILLAALPLQTGGVRRAGAWLPAFLLPLIGLSLFCHQEMRFLLPLLPSACLLIQVALQPLSSSTRRLFFFFWFGFQFLSLVFWGYTHQAGVIPALHYLRSEHQGGCLLAFFLRTYMPPEFLLNLPRSDSCSRLWDYASSPPQNLFSVVMAELAKAGPDAKAFVAFPAAAHHEVLSSGLPIPLSRCALFPWHVSTENLPPLAPILNLPLNDTLYTLKNAFAMLVCPLQPESLPQFVRK